MPLARMGVVLSSSNRWVEPYFRAHAPDTLAIHLTRMRMASRARAALDAAAAEAVEAAKLVAEARVDVIDLQWVINDSLGEPCPLDCDLDGGGVGATDLQSLVNTILHIE